MGETRKTIGENRKTKNRKLFNIQHFCVRKT